MEKTVKSAAQIMEEPGVNDLPAEAKGLFALSLAYENAGHYARAKGAFDRALGVACPSPREAGVQLI